MHVYKNLQINLLGEQNGNEIQKGILVHGANNYAVGAM